MMERYPTHADYCGTDSYQQWLTQWRPPTQVAVDRWHDTEHELYHAMRNPTNITPRAHARLRHATRLAHHLLDTLEIGDRACVDIGCGDNWFKASYPQICGVDPHNEQHRDELLTPEWYITNHGRWPHAFSCNSMHFCDQADVAHNIAKVRSLLRPGGTAVVALNQARIQDHTRDYDPDRLLATVAETPGMTRMIWFDQPQDAFMDGNVWIWLQS